MTTQQPGKFWNLLNGSVRWIFNYAGATGAGQVTPIDNPNWTHIDDGGADIIPPAGATFIAFWFWFWFLITVACIMAGVSGAFWIFERRQDTLLVGSTGDQG